MRANRIYPTQAMWSGDSGVQPFQYPNIANGIQSPVSGSRGSAVRPSNPWLDELIPAFQCADANRESLSGGRQRASGPGSADGRFVRSTGGRSPDGAPQFNQAVDPGNYLWWYVDALSDDGRHGVSIIAFVGSVFSPYYAWANRSQPADANDYCALNVAIYSPGNKRWTMTERGGKWIHRDQHTFQIGPSGLHWDGNCLTISIAERAIPFGQKVAGTIKVYPEQLFQFTTPLDDAEKHRWGPIAPSARVEVSMDQPKLSWHGHAYFDSNEGDEAISVPFTEWDWSRASMKDGSTAVIYDVRQKSGVERLIAMRFKPDGSVEPFEAPARQALKKTGWRIQRHMRTDANTIASTSQLLEDTPFYARSILQSTLLGEKVTSMHETLNVPRLVATSTQLMLPWRMPRIPRMFS